MEYKEQEKKTMLPFIIELENHESDKYIIEWESGTRIIARYFTTYDSDNDLLPSDSNYEEFWTIAIEVLEILVNGPELDNISIHNMIEITYRNQPKSWKKI